MTMNEPSASAAPMRRCSRLSGPGGWSGAADRAGVVDEAVLDEAVLDEAVLDETVLDETAADEAALGEAADAVDTDSPPRD
jgi:hypothetical protein